MNTWHILSESKKIILSNYTHFITLSLFFLPLSFSLITNQLFTIYQKPQIHHILYSVIINIFTISATATVTYSTNRAFFNEPITFFATLNSLKSTFFPLFWTAILTNILLFLISITFLIFFGIILMLLQNLGLGYGSIDYIYSISLVVGVVLVAIMIYFQIIWSLVVVVVVVESKMGFAALIRSSYLVKGMRFVSFLILLYFGICVAGMVWIGSGNAYEIDGGMFGLVKMLATLFMMMILLRISAANTVLYNYCKSLHGELYDHEYVSLPCDYQKIIPHDVTVFVA